MKQSIGKTLAMLGAAVLATASSAAVAVPVISELFYDASGTDAGVVFVELFGVPGESLDGLLLEGVNGGNGAVYASIALGGVVPADGVFVIGDGSDGLTSVANADLVAAVDFQNGPDSVVLRNETSILDAVGYGDFISGTFFFGEGLAAPDPAAGSSIARFDPLMDTDNNSIDFTILDVPTPGVVPAASAVPIPPSALLFCSGGLFLLLPRLVRNRAVLAANS